jgi:hypothetical protein
MRTKYLLAFSIATAALFLPCAAQAQSCEQGPCETWAVFDPNSGTISGGSYYENFDYSDWVMVESYIWDPSYNYTYLGSAVDYEYAEFDFSYTPQMSGMYTIVGYNSYEIEDDGWTPDGESDCSVDATGSPAPVMTSCQLQGSSWVVGSNSIACYGQYFSSIPPSELYLLSWGNNGVGFLQSDTMTIVSDTEIDVDVVLTDIIYNIGYIEVVAASAWQVLQVPQIAPPASFVVQYEAYIPVDHVNGPSYCSYNVNLVQLLYKGDGPSGTTYRAAEGITLVPDPGFSLAPWANTGETRNYGFGSPVNGQTLSSADEDGIANDCYLWNAAGYAAHNWTPTVTYPQSHQAIATLSGTAQNPLEAQFGGIQWNMLVKVDTTNPAAPTALVSYQATCYPAHQVSVNGTVVYTYVPPVDTPAYIVACLLGGFTTGVGPGYVGPVTVPNQ